MKSKRLARLLALSLTLALIPSAPRLLGADEKTPSPGKPVMVLVRAGALVDVTRGTVLKGQEILIENGVVKAVGPDLVAPVGTRIVDLSA
ncbi:MAG TPA: hypothetical protein VF425_06825, partial [Thermoanaerobaculia bacterium]